MTREEAIRVLEKEKRFLFHGSPSDKFYEPAFDMAIEALSQPELIRCAGCHYYADGHCDMHNAGTYPTDYCSYAVWKYEEDES